jgi:phenylalanyl-tRNA synthetase beta chain
LEEFHLGLWLSGNKHSQSWTSSEEKSSIFELKAYVENIFRRLGLKLQQFSFSEISNDLFSQALSFQNASGKQLALYGIVNTELLKSFDIENEVYYADLDWNLLIEETKGKQVSFTEISRFPEVKRDLALLLDKNVTFAEIEKIAYQTERKLLKKVQLFDVYEGKNIETGKKSYAVSFVLQDETKTLTDNQIDAIMQKLMKNFSEKLGAKLR